MLQLPSRRRQVTLASCWMSSNDNLIWTFVAFVIIIEVINILILARVIREMAKMQPTGDKQILQIRLGIRACVVMIPLLGVTWLFGLLTPLHKAFNYVFTILNSTQGFLIFALHCVRNSQIRERFKRKVSTVFPSATNGNSTKKNSHVNMSDFAMWRQLNCSLTMKLNWKITHANVNQNKRVFRE